MGTSGRTCGLVVAGMLSLGSAGCTMVRPPKYLGDSDAPGTSLVTSTELSRYATHGTLRDAIVGLRPWFLYARGSSPVVSIDGGPPNDLTILDSIHASEVIEVRLVRASSAAHAPGGVLPNGDSGTKDVLLVIMRKD